MGILEDRKKQKELYQRYRQEAQDMYNRPGTIDVPKYASVSVMNGGAYVEAVVWVPKENIDDNPSSS